MTMYASPDVEITYDGDDMTPYIQSINGITIEDIMQDSQAFGQVWNQMVPTGAKRVEDIVFTGLFDDVADGPRAKWDAGASSPTPATAPKTLVIRLGGGSPGKTVTIPVHPRKFVIKFTRNQIHEYEATLTKGAGNVTVV